MKELSIEEKARRYDEAKYIMKEYLESGNAGVIAEKTIKNAFPELAESEDERIRKELIKFVKVNIPDQERYIAWLEKQGNTNKEYWRGYREGKQEILDKYTKLEKKERKPADSYCQENCKGFQETGKCFADGECKAKREAEQKSAWSEEDEARFESCIKVLQTSDGYDTINTKWLKSIKDRVQPQPQQEWSEDDEEMFTEIIIDLKALKNRNTGEAGKAAYQREIDWLKSLRPQNSSVTDEELEQAKKDAYNDVLDKIEYHSGEPTFDDGWSAAIWYLKKRNVIPHSQWKPSDEQMKALKESCSEHWEPDGLDPLYTLYQDLKKLKEEQL